MLDLAARVAVRATGHVEPNPLVGCVICKPGPGPARDRLISIGHHRRFGGPHAEAEALARCRELGADPRGATMYVTLEPCNSTGRNPPCVDAILHAGIAQVVCARPDPSPGKGGGASRLIAGGVPVRFTDASPNAARLAEPWLKRQATGLPWVIAKWAQSIDGRLTTAAGQSQWITAARARHCVHQLRARVDAIITGGGTLRADNPRLNARNTPVRRRSLPVVLTSQPLPSGSHLASNPLTIAIDARTGDEIREAFRSLHTNHAVHTAMIEAGPRLLSTVLSAGLADELHVYTAPVLIGSGAPGLHEGLILRNLQDAQRWSLVSTRQRGPDVRTVFRRSHTL